MPVLSVSDEVVCRSAMGPPTKGDMTRLARLISRRAITGMGEYTDGFVIQPTQKTWDCVARHEWLETIWPRSRKTPHASAPARSNAQLELRNFTLEAIAHAHRDVFDRRRITDDVVVSHVERQHGTAVKARDPICITSVE